MTPAIIARIQDAIDALTRCVQAVGDDDANLAEPGMALLRSLVEHPERRPALHARQSLWSLESELRRLAAVAQDRRALSGSDVATLDWVARAVTALARQDWHDPPAPRRPVAIASSHGDDFRVVVCDDGSAFAFDPRGHSGAYWDPLAPIPGTAAARAELEAQEDEDDAGGAP